MTYTTASITDLFLLFMCVTFFLSSWRIKGLWNVKEGDSVHIWRCRFSEECKVRAWRPKAWQIEVTSWFFEHGSYISWFTAQKTRATHVYLIERLSFHGNICVFPRINVVVNVTNDIFFVLNYSLKYSLLYWLCS